MSPRLSLMFRFFLAMLLSGLLPTVIAQTGPCDWSGQGLTAFPPFVNLTRCTTVNLADNVISSYPIEMGPISLQSLDVSNNLLPWMPVLAFAGLTCPVITLSFNPLPSITTGAFNGVKMPSGTLSISNTQVTDIQPNAFQGLSLQNLFLINSNALTTLSPLSFNGVSISYGNLDLSGSSLCDVHPGDLSGLILGDANLLFSHNNISALRNNTFQGVSFQGGIRMYLDNNGMQDMEPASFIGVTGLQQLDLAHNGLTTSTLSALMSLDPTPGCPIDLTFNCIDAAPEVVNALCKSIGAVCDVSNQYPITDSRHCPSLAPSAPINISAVALASAAHVSWSAPAYTGHLALVNYTITSPDDVTLDVAVPSSQLSVVIDGLSTTLSYRFRVYASNAMSDGTPSALSNPVRPCVANSTAPDTPAAPIAVSTGHPLFSVIVFWKPVEPTVCWASPIDRWTIVGDDELLRIVPGNQTNATFVDLHPFTSYSFTVSACNTVGCGPQSVYSNYIRPIGTPSPPLDVIATLHSDYVALTWQSPAYDGGMPLTGYSVDVINAATNASERAIPTNTFPSINVDGLAYNIPVYFTVSGVNALGVGEPSDASNTVIPVPPDVIPGPVRGLFALALPYAVNVSWEQPDNNSTLLSSLSVFYYNVSVCPSGQAVACDSIDIPGDGPFMAFLARSLAPQVEVTVTVSACNDVGCGEASSSAPVYPFGVPSLCSDVRAKSGDASAVVFWSPPVSDGGSPLISFTVMTYNMSSGDNTANTTVAPTLTNATLLSLTNGVPYAFAVIAVNAAGNGPESVLSNTVTPGSPPVVPGPITALTLSAWTLSINVTWDEPSGGDAGHPVLYYDVTVCETTVFACDDVTVNASAVHMLWVLSNLSPSLLYTVNISACNDVGCGPGVSSPEVQPLPVPLLPLPPILGNISVGYFSVGIDWEYGPFEPNAVPLTVWATVYPPDMNGDSTLLLAAYPNTTGTIDTLSEYVTYFIGLYVVNGVGEGPTSTYPHSILPAQLMPPFPLSPPHVFSQSGTTVMFTWTLVPYNVAVTNYTLVLTSGAQNISVATTDAYAAVTGLQYGVSYSVTVTVYKAYSSATSHPALVYSLDITPPSAPVNVLGISSPSGAVLLTWDLPASDGGSTVTNYTIVALQHGVVSSTNTSVTTSVWMTSLADGFSYHFVVYANNAVGASAPSQPSMYSCQPGASRPMLPANASFPPSASEQLTVCLDPDSFPPNFFEVSVENVTATIPAIGGCTTFYDLVNGLPVSVSITSVSCAGRSDPLTVNVSPQASVPSPPLNTDVQLMDDGATAVLSWSEPYTNGGSNIIDYLVTNTMGFYEIFVCCNFTTPELIFDATYNFSILARNDYGSSATVQFPLFTANSAVPSPPVNVSAVSTASNSIDVSWDAPESNGGSPITSYVIDALAYPSNILVQSISMDPMFTSTVVTNLTNGVPVTIRLSAVSPAGVSNYSSFGPVTPIILPPSAPQSLLVIPSDLYASLHWLPPLSSGGADVTGYIIWIKSNGGPAKAVFSVQSPLTTAVHSVYNEDTAQFAVQAVNAANLVGPLSLWSDVYTQSDNVPSSAPAGVTITPHPSIIGSFDVNWDGMSSSRLSHGPSEGYSVIVYGCGEYSSPVTEMYTNASSATVSGLLPGTCYEFGVAASNSYGNGPYGYPFTSAVQSSVLPATPQVPSVALADTVLNVTITYPSQYVGVVTGFSPVVGFVIQTLTAGNGSVISSTFIRVSAATRPVLFNTSVVLSAPSGLFVVGVYALNADGVPSSIIISSPDAVCAITPPPSTPFAYPTTDAIGVIVNMPPSPACPLTGIVLQAVDTDGHAVTITGPFNASAGDVFRYHWSRGLKEGMPYRVAVAVMNAAGQSSFSPNSSAVVMVLGPLPGLPWWAYVIAGSILVGSLAIALLLQLWWRCGDKKSGRTPSQDIRLSSLAASQETLRLIDSHDRSRRRFSRLYHTMDAEMYGASDAAEVSSDDREYIALFWPILSLFRACVLGVTVWTYARHDSMRSALYYHCGGVLLVLLAGLLGTIAAMRWTAQCDEEYWSSRSLLLTKLPLALLGLAKPSVITLLSSNALGLRVFGAVVPSWSWLHTFDSLTSLIGDGLCTGVGVWVTITYHQALRQLAILPLAVGYGALLLVDLVQLLAAVLCRVRGH